MSASQKISSTKNYRLFERHDSQNRPYDIDKHKKLEESMKMYGFLKCFPIVVRRNEKGQLIVKDGQHRLAIAEKLQQAVHFVEEQVDFDIAIVNSTARVWVLRDYARKHAANGLKQYQEGMDFAEGHTIPIGVAFALLAGTTTFGNVQSAFIDGTWKIKDRSWAESVAKTYGPLVKLEPAMKNSRLIEACMAACRVDGFDINRMIENASRCRDKLAAYATRDAYLEMMEEVYNYGRKHLLGLKAAAVMAMRERNATVVTKKAKERKAQSKAA